MVWRKHGEDRVALPVFGIDPVTGLAVTPLDGALIGPVTETAPASDTASSGLNGRLQRIAQRLTSLIALFTGGTARIAGVGVSASVDFTPSASAYGAGDIIGSVGAVPAQQFAFTYADGTPIAAGSLIRILQVVFKIDQTGLQSSEGAYTLHLYNVTPPSAQADNAAWTLASADLAAYRGSLDVGTPVDLGAACYLKTQLTDKQDYKLTGTSLFALLVTTPAFTPAAVVRQVLLYGIVL